MRTVKIKTGPNNQITIPKNEFDVLQKYYKVEKENLVEIQGVMVDEGEWEIIISSIKKDSEKVKIED